jgi:hypothetical protein
MRKAGFLLFGLVGAVLLSQFPEFFQQYVQRLGGRLDEATAQVQALDRRAAEAGKATPDYIRGFLFHDEPNVRREGLALQALVQRRIALAEAYGSLQGADRWWRGGQFVRSLDWDIAASTLGAYRPAVPVTAEAAVYAGAGFGSGMVLFLALSGLFGRRRRRSTSRIR